MENILNLKNNKFIPEKLTSFRIIKGFSKKQLAEKVGLTRQAISQFENGSTIPSPETITKLTRILGCNTRFFYIPFNRKIEATNMFFCNSKGCIIETK